MESNEKKPKRPRIGQSVNMNPDQQTNSSAIGNEYNSDAQHHSDYRPRTPYQQRQNGYNRQGGYNRQNSYNRYNNQGDSGYRPRQQYHAPATTDAEGQATATEGEENQQRTYQQRPYQQRSYQQREGGYNNNRYNNNNNRYNNRQGGYNNNRYNNNRYNNNSNSNQEEGGENTYRPRQNSYGNNRQGGYNNNRYNNNNNRYNNRQGGYNNNRYNNRNQGPRQNQFGMPQGGKSFVPRPKKVEYEAPVIDPNEEIRLNKYMANAGICSRREADEYIQQGLVKVNGNVVTELGTKITHSDTVEYDEKLVTLESKCYILLNKPKDCVTTSDDPNGRLTVMDLVKGACDARIYPVGRLDRKTTGVLLLTNDGDLASKLTHPKYVKKKIYHVWTDKDISEDDMQRIADGIELEDGPIHADAISYATETDRNQAGIEIHSGRNRIVRRLFESLGYHVTKLDRVYFAGLTKKNLPRGRWRYLTQEEVNFLKMGSFE